MIPAAQQAAAAATEQASAQREGTRQSLSVQLVQAYFGQRLAEQALRVRREVRDGLAHLVRDLSRVQESLGGDTATVQARAAQLVALNERYLHSKLCRTKCCGVSA